MKSIIVIAAHSADETLGWGGLWPDWPERASPWAFWPPLSVIFRVFRGLKSFFNSFPMEHTEGRG